MKVSELITWLQSLEPDWEICHKTTCEPHEEISEIVVDEQLKIYTLN